MTFLEKELEQIIYEADFEALEERDLTVFGKRMRQLRIGNYGIADIVTFERGTISPFDTALTITVYELKQNKIDLNSLSQAIRYCKGIARYIHYWRNKEINIRFNIVLIGKEIAGGDFIYFPDFVRDLKLLTYTYGIDGIKFKNHKEYFLTNEGFK